MALHLNMATNLWGDIPYSEAFLGVENLTPKFDDAHALFDTALLLLEAGINLLQQQMQQDSWTQAVILFMQAVQKHR